MAHNDSGHSDAPVPCKSSMKKRKATFLPGFLHAHLQSRQLITSMRLRPADGSGPLTGRGAPAASAAAPGQHYARAAVAAATVRGPCAAAAGDGPKSAPARLQGSSCTYVPVRTLPLIFAQRKRHLQQQKSRAQDTEPYQRRAGEGLLALPEDVLLKVVCLLTHDELKPLFQVCKALRTTLRNAVAYHFNYSTPSRPVEEVAPPALGERQRRPARTNVAQVMSRLSRGGARMASGRGAGAARSTAPRALNFAGTTPTEPAVQAVVASRA